MNIQFFVYGKPIGQPRPRFTCRSGFAKPYKDGKHPIWAWRNAIRAMALQNKPDSPIIDPLMVSVTFFFDRPKSHYGTGKNANKLKGWAPQYHISKPDVDNMEKAVFDELENCGFYKNDSQICKSVTYKCYVDLVRKHQGAQIKISTL